ncbi:MAG: hypothetical protein ACLP2X_22040, partial [Syntrophobacteraceae bacterium]
IELYASPRRGKTTYRRAVCGRSACTVRREGRCKPMRRSYPYPKGFKRVCGTLIGRCNIFSFFAFFDVKKRVFA